ncbi:MAG: hypothetical protein PHT07_06035 [Paludibacter sp.]|nr:hypothetical protein [Paludibacter sp.]
MEPDKLSQFELTGTEEIVKIYSKRAVWGFSIFFTSIFGGVLLMQNLFALQKKKEAYQVLAFSVVYTALSIYILNLFATPNTGSTYLVNAIGGLVLSEFFFKRNIPDENILPKKKIWKALIISLIIMIPFAAALFLA